MMLSAATDTDATEAARLDYFKKALDMWPAGSYEQERIIRQHPQLVQALKKSGK